MSEPVTSCLPLGALSLLVTRKKTDAPRAAMLHLPQTSWWQVGGSSTSFRMDPSFGWHVAFCLKRFEKV